MSSHDQTGILKDKESNSMAMNVKPLSDRILVRRLEDTEVKRGGIIIPDTAKEKPQQGEVIAVGPGRFEDGKRIPLDVKKGDKVLMGKYSGSEVKIDGTDYIIIREDEVLAIVA
jgi:chaperonin GroES